MPLVFELPERVEQVAERLRRVTGPLAGADASFRFLGEIDLDGFRVKANPASRSGVQLQSSFSPAAIGRFITRPSGCRVEVRIGPSAWTLMATAVWIVVIGSMVVRRLPEPWSMDTSIEAITTSRDLGILLFILTVGIAATGFALALGWHEAGRMRAELQETFGALRQ